MGCGQSTQSAHYSDDPKATEKERSSAAAAAAAAAAATTTTTTATAITTTATAAETAVGPTAEQVGSGDINGKSYNHDSEEGISANDSFERNMNCSGSVVADVRALGIVQNMRSAHPKPNTGDADTGISNELCKSPSRRATFTHNLRNVFATRIEEGDLESFTPPVVAKSNEATDFLRKALQNNFIFQHLPERQLESIIDAFEQVEFAVGDAIITQGDIGDYFFIVYKGECSFHVSGKHVGTCEAGGGFGELALLYSSPRAASVHAISPAGVVCFRVDQKTFRYVLQAQNQNADSEKIIVLKQIAFLKGLENLQLQRLSAAMTLKCFKEGDHLVRKGEVGDAFYILHEGEVKVTDIVVGNTAYEDFTMNRGEYFGERAILKSEPRVANVVATTDGVVFSIDRTTFENVLGDVEDLILRSQDKRRLAGIKCIHDTYLESTTLDLLAGLMEDTKFSAGSTIMTENEETEPTLYIVRSGKCQVTKKDLSRDDSVKEGEFFGEDHLLMDVGKKRRSRYDQLDNKDNASFERLTYVSDYTVTVLEDTVCGLLRLEDCRLVFDTTRIGQGKRQFTKSQVERSLSLETLKRHKILGQGTFGQVWLVTYENPLGEDLVYALKIQSKYELVQEKQVQGVVQELEILNQLHHPFIIPLIKTFQDVDFIYMLLGLVQGGELYNRLHTEITDGVPENEARFYGACIAEALSVMHRAQVVYRDLKPENILLNHQGYPTIVDFGFAKFVEDWTYTFCGTPLYIAPEIITNRGHSIGVDHWSLGCIIYEMITGETPFYLEGMDQLALYQAIVDGTFQIHPLIASKKHVLSLVRKFLVVNPSRRLGSLKGGLLDIFHHPWFHAIDFDLLRNKEIPPPWIPTIVDPLDTSNFEDFNYLDDKAKESFPPIDDKHQNMFAVFDGV